MQMPFMPIARRASLHDRRIRSVHWHVQHVTPTLPLPTVCATTGAPAQARTMPAELQSSSTSSNDLFNCTSTRLGPMKPGRLFNSTGARATPSATILFAFHHHMPLELAGACASCAGYPVAFFFVLHA
jgi:hypothetical protein